jgi:hypothetical protein
MSIKLELDKINIYQKGGFFNSHRDTPKLNMIGTLLLILPSEFSGGNFNIGKNKLDFGSKSKDHIQWVAFYSDTLHSVEEVLSGNRITATYDIYSDSPIDKVDESKTTDIIKPIDSNLMVHTIFSNTRVGDVWFGYFCNYMYTDSNENNLKGVDKKIFEMAQSSGFKISIHNLDFQTNVYTCNCSIGGNKQDAVYFGEEYRYCDCGNTALYRDNCQTFINLLIDNLGEDIKFNTDCSKITKKKFFTCRICEEGIHENIIDICDKCRKDSICETCNKNATRCSELCEKCVDDIFKLTKNNKGFNLDVNDQLDCAGRLCLKHDMNRYVDISKMNDDEVCESCYKKLKLQYKEIVLVDNCDEVPDYVYCNDCGNNVMSNLLIPSIDINKYHYIEKDIVWINNVDSLDQTKIGTYVYGNYPSSDIFCYKTYCFLFHVTDDINSVCKERNCTCGITYD